LGFTFANFDSEIIALIFDPVVYAQAPADVLETNIMPTPMFKITAIPIIGAVKSYNLSWHPSPP
jgi:hypothetical protein